MWTAQRLRASERVAPGGTEAKLASTQVSGVAALETDRLVNDGRQRPHSAPTPEVPRRPGATSRKITVDVRVNPQLKETINTMWTAHASGE